MNFTVCMTLYATYNMHSDVFKVYCMPLNKVTSDHLTIFMALYAPYNMPSASGGSVWHYMPLITELVMYCTVCMTLYALYNQTGDVLYSVYDTVCPL